MIFFSLSPLIVGQLIYNELSNITRMNGKNYYKPRARKPIILMVGWKHDMLAIVKRCKKLIL